MLHLHVARHPPHCAFDGMPVRVGFERRRHGDDTVPDRDIEAGLPDAGVPIERMMFWVPHPGDQLGMGVSIMSYHGKASLAVIADARLVPDPQAITDEFVVLPLHCSR